MKKNISSFVIIIGFFFLCLFPAWAGAHATGSSWEKIVGDYKVDVGYDPTTFIVGQPQRFDFNAFDTINNQVVNFSDVWVRLAKGEETVFASGIHKPEFGLTGMIFEFPKEGNYMLSLRFENAEKSFVEASFPITVGAAQVEESASPNLKLLMAAGLGLLVGAVVTWLLARRIKIRHE